MSLEWDILSWKEKKAIKLSLKNGGDISMSIIDDIFSSEDPKEKMRKFRKHDLIEKINIGNKYEVNRDKIPEDVLNEVVEV